MIGSGGTSTVYLAEHIRLQSYRAVKRIRKDHRFHEQLMNEAKILKNLKHPNIPVIYDMEEDKEYSYIIEEFLEGQSLKAVRLCQNNILEELIVDYAIQICDLFLYIHALATPILYLDLKPDNILVYNNILKLIDFGTAIYAKDTDNRTISFGTRGYAAPEQYGIQTVDERSDIYGLGVLLFFLVTKEIYSFDSPSDSLALLEEAISYSVKLKEIIRKCLQHSPSKRYQNVTQLRKKLITLQGKTEVNPKENSKQSLVIAVAGSQNRIGTTHIGLLITSYLNQYMDKALYIEKNSDFIVQEIMNQYHNVPNKNNLVFIKHCVMLSGLSVNEADFMEYRMRIHDYGVLTRKNSEEFLQADIKLLVVGIKEWELKHSIQCLKELMEVQDIYYLFNFAGEKEFEHAMDNMEKASCIRVPYHPNPYSVEHVVSVKNFMNEIFQEKGYEKKTNFIKKHLLFQRTK